MTAAEEIKKSQQESDMAEQDRQKEKRKQIDFKMVTFTLAGKDYGIDIMKVKEISKIGKFTFVPNTAPYVRGVYNLRGDIISVIDLRAFFNLEFDVAAAMDSKQVNMIILRLEDRVLAVIVDAIDKVVGIAKETVQPPHPLFGDINIKYISGIVENNNHLYILLDVDKIFSTESLDSSILKPSRLPETVPAPAVRGAKTAPAEQAAPVRQSAKGKDDKDDINYKFIEETLVTFRQFYPSPVNREWIRKRFSEWKEIKKGAEIQLQNETDASEYLSSFYSPYAGHLWGGDYLTEFESVLPEDKGGVLNIWNPGCGAGYETYSIACSVRKKYPEVVIKIRGNDNDLINISMAPGLMIDINHIPEFYKSYVVEGPKGSQFSKEIKDLVIFEYHDIAHNNTLPALDIVVARDILSFMDIEAQEYFFTTVLENLKPDGILILGKNERVSDPKLWNVVEKNGFIAYKKK